MLRVLKLWSEAAGHQPRLKTCSEEEIDFDTAAEVVAFCVYTNGAPAAYRAAKQLRDRGVVVILGGPHFGCQMTISEGSQIADVIVPSICQEQWVRLLNEIARGEVRAGGTTSVIDDADHEFCFPENFHEAYQDLKYFEFPLVFTTLGCPYRCEYCTPLMAGMYRARDVATTFREVSTIAGKIVVIADATFGLDRKHTLELMKSIAPLKKQIFIETTLARLDDDELLDAFAAGGVKWLAVGIEALSTEHKKHGRNQVRENSEGLRRIIDRVVDRGMLLQGNFICGLDTQGEQDFEAIYELYRTTRLTTIYIDLLVPYPSSDLFRQLEGEGRLFDRDWSHYDFEHLVYRARGMSGEQLISRFIALNNKLMSKRLLIRKTWQALSIGGFCKGTMVMILWNLHKTFDARARARRILENFRRSPIAKSST